MLPVKLFHVEQMFIPKDYQCINCGKQNGTPKLIVKDYYLSGEEYSLIYCNSCHLIQTHPRPSLENLGSYYASEKYISHSAKHESFFSKVYGLFQRINILVKYKFSVEGKSIGKVMDIGCGNGAMLDYFAKKGWEATGIEPSDLARSVAKKVYNLQVFDEEHLNEFENGSFDVITLWHVLEHVYNLPERIQEIRRLLRKDGSLILALPNPYSLDATYYKEFWAAYDVPRHLYHFAPDTIEEIMKNYGFSLIKTKTLWFDSFYVSLLSEKYKASGLLGIVRAILIGVVSNLWSVIKRNRGSSQMYRFKL